MNKRTGDEVLATGSIIHWSERDPDNSSRVMVTCGECCLKRLAVPYNNKSRKPYLGLCNPCVGVRKRGDKHPNWRGGRTIDDDGYILLHRSLFNDEQLKFLAGMFIHTGYVFEHRAVVAIDLKRPLTSDEVVHHLNENKQDNRWQNLGRFSSQSEHSTEHQNLLAAVRHEVGRLQGILDANKIPY